MADVKRRKNKSLERVIKEQNLKFTVEFDNGKDPVTDKYDDDFEEFEDEHTRREPIQRHVQESSDVAKSTPCKSKSTALDTDINKNVNEAKSYVNNDHLNKTEGKKHKIEKQNIDHFKLPVIQESGGKTQRVSNFFSKRHGAAKLDWKKPGDSGEIPIQARNRGPGPAQYMLPTTVGRNNADVTIRHSPSFSFGSRSWSFKTDSPGPAYGFDALMGTRGKENRPAYSFGIRPKTPVNKNATPGPAAYNTDMHPLWEQNAPQYSISPRNKMRSVDEVPSPNSYMLPTTLGSKVPHLKGGIAVSIYPPREKNSYAEDLAKTPGPAKYSAYSPNLIKRQSPQYTILGRNYAPEPKVFSPGPGKYNTKNVTSHLEQTPRHVIGVRHSEFVMPTLTPADASD